jgi:hypothetical protein
VTDNLRNTVAAQARTEKPATRDNWFLIVTALILFWPVGIVLLVKRPQMAVKSEYKQKTARERIHKTPKGQRGNNTTDNVVAVGEFFMAVAVIGGILFLIGALTGVMAIAGIGFFIGLPSFVIAAAAASHVDEKRKNYYYWRHYKHWK